MKILSLLVLILSFNASAARSIECVSPTHRVFVEKTKEGVLRVTFGGETVLADGVLDNDQVDLVAKFSSVGEMTLFAKLNKVAFENYLFMQGQRNPVVCR